MMMCRPYLSRILRIYHQAYRTRRNINKLHREYRLIEVLRPELFDYEGSVKSSISLDLL